MQLVSYGLVGIASNLAVYVAYLVITYLGFEPKKAMTCLYIMGAAIGFYGNHRWTFANNGRRTAALQRYVIVHVLGYLLNLVILYAFVDCLGYPHQLVQAVTIGLVASVLFLAFKYYVFPRKEACAS